MTLLAILGIGFLIFVHEWGHFIACRLTKTRTETFSIGFGPRLFGWESVSGEPKRFTWGKRRLDAARGAMDFRVSVVPLGGYVKMAGENPGERSGKPDEFPNKPTWARVFIICAGVIMNAIAAVALYFAAFAGGMEMAPAVIGAVETGGAAWQAGLKPGDRVTSVDGANVRTFYDLRMETVLLSRGEEVVLEAERDGKPLTLRAKPQYHEEPGALHLGVSQGVDLLVEVDGKTFEVGHREDAVVAGLPVRGGALAYGAIDAAIAAGIDPVVVAKADGSSVSLALAGREPDAKARETREWRLGVEPHGSPKVTDARGEGGAVLHKGDLLVAATLGDGTEADLAAASELKALPFRGAVKALRVQRDGAPVTLPVDLATPAAIKAFFDDVALEMPKTMRIRPQTRNLTFEEPYAQRFEKLPAVEAGLQKGDEIVAIGKKRVGTFMDMKVALQAIASGEAIDLTVKGADDVERTVKATPVRPAPLAGLKVRLREHKEPVAHGVGEAFPLALARTKREVVNVFRLIGSFFTGSVSFNKNIGGPIMLVTASSDAAQSSFALFLAFLAYISVSLAVLNILPIPLLDGGHLLIMTLEKIKGAPLKESTVGVLQMVGLVLVLTLLGFAMKNDLTRVFR